MENSNTDSTKQTKPTTSEKFEIKDFDKNLDNEYTATLFDENDIFRFLRADGFNQLNDKEKILHLIKICDLSICSEDLSNRYCLNTQNAKLVRNIDILESTTIDIIFKYLRDKNLDSGVFYNELKKLRIDLLNLFLEEYTILNRKEIYISFFKKNINRYFSQTQVDKAFDEVVLRDFFVYCMLARAYIFLGDIPNFVSSAVSASFAFGKFTEKGQTNFDEIIKEFKSKEMSQNSLKRWGNGVEKRRQRYLKHFKNQGFTTYKACAKWICENDNPEGLEYETIYQHLSKADKEQKSQK